MSIGTIWNHRDFIEAWFGKEDAIEFEQVVKKYQAEQVAIERERIIKLLEELDDEEWMGINQNFIALIKGENK